MYYEAYFNSDDKNYVYTEITPGFIDLMNYDPGTKDYNKLTGGEIAGIVIGALIGVALIVLLIVCVIIKIKRKRSMVQDKTHID